VFNKLDTLNKFYFNFLHFFYFSSVFIFTYPHLINITRLVIHKIKKALTSPKPLMIKQLSQKHQKSYAHLLLSNHTYPQHYVDKYDLQNQPLLFFGNYLGMNF